jgi:hypothetical protein
MSNLRDLPAGVRVIDHLEFASDSPENSSAPPRATVAAPVAITPAATSATPAPALTVTSQPPGASIFVNGERQSEQTPAKIDLPAGSYRIAVSKPGFAPYSSPVEIRAGEPAHLYADLSPLAQGDGWVVVRTVPKGALITIDGVLSNQQTPARLDLPAGQHLLLFSLAGYTAQSSVIVRAGKGSQIFQVLNRP